MALNDAQPVSLGMLKNILAAQAKDVAAETAALQAQITARFLQARKELSETFSRGIAVS